MDTTPLRDAYRALLEAAATVAAPAPDRPAGRRMERRPDPGARRLVNAATIAAVVPRASGAVTTYDNRMAHDTWTIGRVIALAGGNAGLRERVRLQGDALCALGGPR